MTTPLLLQVRPPPPQRPGTTTLAGFTPTPRTGIQYATFWPFTLAQAGGTPPSNFSWLRWGWNVAGGFSEDALLSIQELFTLRGIATAVISGAALTLFPSLELLLYVPTVLGLIQFGVGVYQTADENRGALVRQDAGRQVGRGLFYAFPLFSLFRRRLVQKKADLLKALFVEQEEAQGGRIVTRQAELESFALAFREELKAQLEGLPPEQAERILASYDHPLPKGLEPVEGVVSLAHVDGFLEMHALEPFMSLKDPLLRALAGVALAAVKFHEGIHLAQRARRFPKLADYCRCLKVNDPLLHDLLPWRLRSHRAPLLETLLYRLIQFPRGMEMEAYAAEHRAINKILNGVSWGDSYIKVLETVAGQAEEGTELTKEVQLVEEFEDAIGGMIAMARGSGAEPFAWSVVGPSLLSHIAIAGRDPLSFAWLALYVYCSARWGRESASSLLRHLFKKQRQVELPETS